MENPLVVGAPNWTVAQYAKAGKAQQHERPFRSGIKWLSKHMKFSLIFFAITLYSITPAFSQNPEEVAIRALIEAETQAFVNHSFADVAKMFWIMDDKTMLNVTGPDGSHVQILAEEILERTDAPPPNHAKVVKSNFHYMVNGNMAAAYNDQVVTIQETGFILYSSEVRIMEKVDGIWKIHLSSVHHFEQ